MRLKSGLLLSSGFFLRQKVGNRAGTARWTTGSVAQGTHVELEFGNGATQGIAVHPELARGLTLVAIVFLQNSEDKSFLKFPYGFRIKDSTFVHLHYECFQLVLHGDPFLTRYRGLRPIQSLTVGAVRYFETAAPEGFSFFSGPEVLPSRMDFTPWRNPSRSS